MRQSFSRVRQVASAVEQAVSKMLPYPQHPLRCLELERPWILSLRFGRRFNANRDAVFALFSITVTRQFRITLIGDEICIRGFHRARCHVADRLSQLVMIEASNGFVVGRAAPLNLHVSKGKRTSAGLVSKIASQRTEMEGMDQLSEHGVSALKLGGVLFYGLEPVASPVSFVIRRNQNVRLAQNPLNVVGILSWRRISGNHLAEVFDVLIACPERPYDPGGWVVDPHNPVAGAKVFSERNPRSLVRG